MAAAGDPHHVAYMRSAAKPFQAMAVVHSGAFDQLGLTLEELAIACASHNAEKRHVEAVRSFLRKAGLGERDLECGYHDPFFGGTLAYLIDEGTRPGGCHHNCSGKHAGMLAVCRVADWPLKGYTDPDHPLQRYLLDIMSIWMDTLPADIVMGIDGCGAPVAGLALSTMAGGWARLAAGRYPGAEWDRPARLVREAMKSHPFMVGGTDRICTALNAETPYLSKGGAEGVYCMGSLERDWGLAVKIEDGAGRASGMAALRTSTDLPSSLGDLPPEVSRFLRVPLKNTRGEEVGRIIPADPWMIRILGGSVEA